MAKAFSCADAGVDCSWSGRAENEPELMKKIAEHARTAHQMTEIPPELARKVQSGIRDEK